MDKFELTLRLIRELAADDDECLNEVIDIIDAVLQPKAVKQVITSTFTGLEPRTVPMPPKEAVDEMVPLVLPEPRIEPTYPKTKQRSGRLNDMQKLSLLNKMNGDHGLALEEACQAFGVNKTAYYDWSKALGVKRREWPRGKRKSNDVPATGSRVTAALNRLKDDAIEIGTVDPRTQTHLTREGLARVSGRLLLITEKGKAVA